jgi:hypothetical protein
MRFEIIRLVNDVNIEAVVKRKIVLSGKQVSERNIYVKHPDDADMHTMCC